MRLTTTGTPSGPFNGIIGILAAHDVAPEERHRRIRLISPQEEPASTSVFGYRAVLFADSAIADCPLPHIQRLREWDHLRHGDIVTMDGSGTVRSLYRPYESHHHLFVTERCNSNCLMCSQPPKDRDDVEFLTERNLQLIELIDQPPPYLTITGGEPTLLGEHLFRIIDQLKAKMPETELHVLTNGRTFAWPKYTQRFASIGHPNISLGVPLYADVAAVHDHVVQARGAFDQTVSGLHQAARNGIRTEIRIVLHKLTIPRLGRLAEYIYRNLTFVEHIALMGLEYTGYTPRNIDQLWIDPFDYQEQLLEAVKFLAIRNMNVSIYNHQLCTLDRRLWQFARKSISDWKNLYLPECQGCEVKSDCGGFFQWATKKHSDHIVPISMAVRT
jgi:His-Xaa-Ser system radical SAM maturase HxsC